MKPMPKKPRIIIVQVEASGTPRPRLTIQPELAREKVVDLVLHASDENVSARYGRNEFQCEYHQSRISHNYITLAQDRSKRCI
jgi:hypothetical protein